MKFVNAFDIDGVIFFGSHMGGVYPGPDDIIVTGRSTEEYSETVRMLERKSIYNRVYFNPQKFDEKTRVSSGAHKAAVFKRLHKEGTTVVLHFEDDPIQAEEIRRLWPSTTVVLLQHDLVDKENRRHDY